MKSSPKNKGYMALDAETTPEKKSLSDNGIYYFAEDISLGSVKPTITWIMESNMSKGTRYDHLTLIISSYGGSVHAAFSLIDAIQGSAIPIHTVGLGIIASAGLVTFIAGEPGHRVITPNTSMLSHQWAWGSSGKEHELISQQKEYDLMNERMLRHYKRCTGLSEKKIRKHLLSPSDRWLSAEEALKYNLVDEVKGI